MLTAKTLTEAAEKSAQFDCIVEVEYQSKHADKNADADFIRGELEAEYTGEVDCTWTDAGHLDIWGYREDAPEGEMEWRLLVKIVG